jgi:pimeloyl-[acyl-carrier protein] methyl ester esterase
MSLPLVLLHGWGLNSRVWENLQAALSPDLRVIAADLPGHGGTSPLASGSLDALTCWLSARFPGPVNVLGWSLGGMVALQWATRFPHQVQRLVLVSSTPRFSAAPGWDSGIQPEVLKQFAQGLRDDFDGTLKRFLSLQTQGDETAREATRRLRESLLAAPRPDGAALQDGLDILLNADLRDTLARIACPALVLHGGRDALTPFRAGKWMAENLPDARLHHWPGSAHTPFLTHADEFARLVREFLA